MTTSAKPAVLNPTDLRTAHEALADSAGPIRISGAGTAANWAGKPETTPLVLDTTGLSGVLAYNPGDMTVSVLAGTPLSQLAEELAGHRQRLAFDAARVPRGATVGGLVATADSGPSALAYGSMRDLMIGTTIILADGTIARSGGHVIKNVAGYDLTKLMHGSYGTLGLLTEVVLRLHPQPDTSATVRLHCRLGAAARHCAAVLADAHEPVAVEWYGPTPDEGTLLIRLEGTEVGIGARAAALAAVLGSEADVLPTDAAVGSWQRHAEVADPAPGKKSEAVLRIGCRPSRLAGLLANLASDRCLTGATAGLATGIATITLPARSDAIGRAHDALNEIGGTSVLRQRPDTTSLPAWGRSPSAVRVLAAVKRELDPDTRFGVGRFERWLTTEEAP